MRCIIGATFRCIFSALSNIFDKDFGQNSYRSSRPEVFLRKGILKICRKFTEEHPCQSAISIKLQSNFNEITRRPCVFSCKSAAYF